MRERLVLRLLGGVLLLLALGYGALASQLPKVEFGDPMGPRAFPLIQTALLVLAALLVLRESWVVEPAELGVDFPNRHDLAQISLTTATSLVYVALLNPLGFLISTSLFLVALLLVYDRGHPVRAVLVAVGYSLGSYLMFRQLQVSLPPGILPV